MSWSFALINGRLAEIFFEREESKKEPKVIGHCYVSADEYKTKYEQKWIERDTKRYQLSYRNKTYRDKIRNTVLQNASREADDGSTKGMPIEKAIALLEKPKRKS